jgi:hypothetical protein
VTLTPEMRELATLLAQVCLRRALREIENPKKTKPQRGNVEVSSFVPPMLKREEPDDCTH